MILKLVRLIFLLAIFSTAITDTAKSYKKCTKIAKTDLCLTYHLYALDGCTDMLEFYIDSSTQNYCILNTTNCKLIRDTCGQVLLPPSNVELLPEAHMPQAITTSDATRTNNKFIQVSNNYCKLESYLDKIWR